MIDSQETQYFSIGATISRLSRAFALITLPTSLSIGIAFAEGEKASISVICTCTRVTPTTHST